MLLPWLGRVETDLSGKLFVSCGSQKQHFDKQNTSLLVSSYPRPDTLFWHSIWHSIWHIFRNSIRHSIWHLFWHSIWHICSDILSGIYSKILSGILSGTYMFWHPIWQSFWQSIWHVFGSRRIPQLPGLVIWSSGPHALNSIRSWQRGWTQQRWGGEGRRCTCVKI